MNYKITSYATFDKEVKRLNKRYRSLKQDLATFVKELLQNPEIGTDLGNGFRKIRLQ
jgi:mRNA-degrading endonuclease RelE of RelBE toxin-antitoxin system